MSDYIPFDIQMKIIKNVYDVKPLIRFRSVSKPWKSFIDSYEFINWYDARNTHPHSFLLSYKFWSGADDVKHIRLVEDDTFKVQIQELAPPVVSPLIKQFSIIQYVGTCHGLVCLVCYVNVHKEMIVIWNPSIQKSFGIASYSNARVDNHYGTGVPPDTSNIYGFGVHPDTSDPTVVKIIETQYKPWHVEVFTLSLGVWNVIQSGNLPRQSLKLDSLTQVVIGRFIYWVAWEMTHALHLNHYMVVSFDLITKEFKLIRVPDSLTYKRVYRGLVPVSLCKLRESLVVYGPRDVAEQCGVWVMQHDSSFTKLFSIRLWIDKLLGFMDSGEPISQTQDQSGRLSIKRVYDRCSQQIHYLEMDGGKRNCDMGSYKESLLLLDHSYSRIYCDKTVESDDNTDEIDEDTNEIDEDTNETDDDNDQIDDNRISRGLFCSIL
ncbi:probable galacturonosyltransferase 7 isoform X2 [Tanacetum coccineum]